MECQIFTQIVLTEKNWRSQNFDLPSLRNLYPGQFLASSNSQILKLLVGT